MIQVNAMGDACPIPVIKTKKAMDQMTEPGIVETMVDNEIAVQNLTRLAGARGCRVWSEKLGENQYKVSIEVQEISGVRPEEQAAQDAAEESVCVPDARKHMLVVISSSKMGEGNEELGGVLLKGFLYALTQLETLPETILFYNGGARMTCEDSPALEDLKSLEAQGVEILTCGTCLNYYGLSEKLQVGQVTNMYVIAEKMAQADKIIKP